MLSMDSSERKREEEAPAQQVKRRILGKRVVETTVARGSGDLEGRSQQRVQSSRKTVAQIADVAVLQAIQLLKAG